MSGELVLVTGGSGFIGGHCIIQLLKNGYRVRTTVRSPGRESDVREIIASEGVETGELLSFATADLTSDDGWADAVKGCDFVLHVASPFPAVMPKDESSLIVPAREGALRVLRAARDARTKRVVLTSSFAAIGYGHEPTDAPFTEETWTDVNGANVTAYAKSKTLAERAAWEFVSKEGGSTELAVVNPVAVLGPILAPDVSTSIMIVQRLLDGSVPGCPRISFSLVDVRDVADLHLRAMTNPAARGERFLAVADESMTMREIALTLRENLGEEARRVPTREIPDWILRIFALLDKSAAQIVPELGRPRNATNQKARRLLGWSPRSNQDAIVATAKSLLKLGLVGRVKKQK